MPKKLFVTIMISAILAQNHAFAQTGQTQASAFGPRKQVATIIFSGLAGAVLGLSTLSFYGRPQDRLSNIAVGFAVGVIIGTGYTTFRAATTPRDYGPEVGRAPAEAELWRLADASKISPQGTSPLGLNWSLTF